MRFHLDYLPNHGIYGLHNDVLSFFANCRTQTRFRAGNLFTDSLQNVINDSRDLLPKFKTVFREINRPGIDKELVYRTLINNNEIVNLLTDVTFPFNQFPSPQYDNLKRSIKSLYSFLWSSTVKTDTVVVNYGCLNNHYTQLDGINKSRTDRICSFCGLEKLKNPKEKRNEYDHYLDQATYPFSTINFLNLVPMCDSCNKRPNKGTQNIIIDETTNNRRSAYYPYSRVENFTIDLACNDIFGNNCEWNATTNPVAANMAFQTWKTVFKIDFRYSNFVDSSYERWLKDFNSYYNRTTPPNLIELRTRIATYIAYCNDLAVSEGDFLEKKFWNYFYLIPDADLNLFLTYLTQLNIYLNN